MSQISIIVPVYNVERYISRCIDSILVQSYDDFELILVDDGSSDSCGKICDEYAETDNRVIVIHQENAGLSAARNAGIDWAFRHSDSQWISFIDSDDWVHKEYLSCLFNAACDHNAAVSVCNFYKTNGETPESDQNSLISQLWPVERLFVEYNIVATVAWGKLYKKSFFDSIRYPVGKIHEDEFVTYQILFRNEQIAVVMEALYMYYQNPLSIMHSKWSTRRLDILEALEERIDFFDALNNEKMLQYTKIQLEVKIAYSNLRAYKEKKHMQIPKKYKLHFVEAANTLETINGTDIYETTMWEFFPHYVKLQAIFRKMKELILGRSLKKRGILMNFSCEE